MKFGFYNCLHYFVTLIDGYTLNVKLIMNIVLQILIKFDENIIVFWKLYWAHTLVKA